MKIKDYIVVTLLGLAGFVISMVGGMATQAMGTYGMFVHVAIGSLLCGPIYFVMCHKVPKRGAAFLYYLILGIIYSIMGFLPMLVIMLVAGLLAEVLIGSVLNYKNDSKLTISYMVSQMIYALHGLFFILFFGVEGLVETFPELFTLEMAQSTADTFLDIKVLTIIVIIQLIASFIGCKFGASVNAKFFSKKAAEEIL